MPADGRARWEEEDDDDDDTTIIFVLCADVRCDDDSVDRDGISVYRELKVIEVWETEWIYILMGFGGIEEWWNGICYVCDCNICI